MFIYKIRNKETGLFSTGSAYPRWTKTGKSWAHMGHLNRHLTMCKDGSNPEWYKRQYGNCEIVTFEIIEVGRSSVIETPTNVKQLTIPGV